MRPKQNRHPPVLRRPTIGMVADASCVASRGVIARDGYFHGRVEWQLYDLATGCTVLRSHVQPRSTINIGEFCGVVAALRYLHDGGRPNEAVYSDSKIACSWARRRVLRTRLPEDEHTRAALEDARTALQWLLLARPKNPVIWWRREWGESPADFGRK